MSWFWEKQQNFILFFYVLRHFILFIRNVPEGGFDYCKRAQEMMNNGDYLILIYVSEGIDYLKVPDISCGGILLPHYYKS